MVLRGNDMPFIKQLQRKQLLKGYPCEAVGDICYLAYQKMVKAWSKEPRWTTYHNILLKVRTDPMSFFTTKEQNNILTWNQEDIITAVHAAEKVFFIWYVVDYERKKEKENGEII